MLKFILSFIGNLISWTMAQVSWIFESVCYVVWLPERYREKFERLARIAPEIFTFHPTLHFEELQNHPWTYLNLNPTYKYP